MVGSRTGVTRGLIIRWTICVALFATGEAFCDNRDRLAELLVTYQHLGLPMPKKDDVRLAICESVETIHRNGGEKNIVERFPGLTSRSWKDGARSPWRGADRALACWTIDRFSEVTDDKIKEQLINRTLDIAHPPFAKSRQSLPFGSVSHIESDGKWCQPFWVDRFWLESPADTLIVAIQCHHFGWQEVADKIYNIVCARIPTDAEQTKLLYEYAWDFWCLRFRWHSDRRAIVARLKDILSTYPSLNSPGRINMLEDMRQTIAPVYSAVGSAEADIDALRSIEMADDLFYSRGSAPVIPDDLVSLDELLDEEPSWKRLRRRGLEAIPALVQHIDDFRLTRSISKSNDYIWHVRIADLVAILLEGMAHAGFAYDFLESEGRGVALDRQHVEYWLKHEKGRIRNLPFNGQSGEYTPLESTEISPRADEFQNAIINGDLTFAQQLIKEDPKIVNSMSPAWKKQSNLTETPLSIATRIAKPSVIKFLLENGADPNLADSVDSLPIFQVRDAAMAEDLLTHGARWDVRNGSWGRTPLQEAAWQGDVDVVRALMKAGVPLDFESAAVLNLTNDMRKMLKSKPWLMKLPSQSLQWAAFRGAKEAVQFLLDNGADIDAGLPVDGPWRGSTALSLAVTSRHYDVAELLLKRGASTDVQTIVGNGNEPLSSFVRDHLDQRWNNLFEGRFSDTPEHK